MLMPVVQILEIQDEDPKDWMPSKLVDLINDPEAVAAAMAKGAAEAQEAAGEEEPLFVDPADAMDPEAAPAPAGGPIPTSPGSLPTGIEPVVPRDEIASPVRDSVEALGADMPVA